MANLDHPKIKYDALFDDIYNDTENFNKLDFWVSLGDEATSLANCIEGWENVQDRYYKNVPTPLILTQGNHDVYSYLGGGGYPLGWSSRPYDNNLWISLNETNDIRTTHAIYQQGILFLFLGDRGEHRILQYGQKIWLQHLTSLYPDTTTIIFSHEGQIDDEHTWPNGGCYGFYNDKLWWENFFMDNPQIELWVNGHGHSYNDPHNKLTVFYNYDPLTYILVPAFQKGNDDKVGYLKINENSMNFCFWDVESKSFSDNWLITTSTTFNVTKKGWFSFPLFLEDGELQWFDNKILSPNINLQLVGWKDPEMFGNPNLTWFDQCNNYDWIYFGNDFEEEIRQWNGETIPYSQNGEPFGVLSIDSGGFITFPHKHAVGYAPWDNYLKTLNQGGNCFSHIGCGYEMFGAQPQGAVYDVFLTTKTDNATGHITLKINCSKQNNIYEIIPESQQTVIDTDVNESYETYQGSFTIPNKNISIINGLIECFDCPGVDWYNISYLSIKRNAIGEDTKDFCLKLGNYWYNSTGILNDCEYVNYSVDIFDLLKKGKAYVKAKINGNKKGFARLIFETPILLARNGRFKLNRIHKNSNIYNITITDKLSMNNDFFYLTPVVYDYGNLSVSKGEIINTINNNIFSKTIMDSTTFEVSYGPIVTSPYEPHDPCPENGDIDVDINSKLTWSGYNSNYENIIAYDVYFGNNADPPLVSHLQENRSYNPGKMDYNTTYFWKVVAWRNFENTYNSSIWSFRTEAKSPPYISYINGPSLLKPNVEGFFTIEITDKNNDFIYVYIEWDDGDVVPWDGPFCQNTDIIFNHSWEKIDDYVIKIKAKDEIGLETDWTLYDIRISNPRDFLLNYFSNFIIRFKIIRFLFRK